MHIICLSATLFHTVCVPSVTRALRRQPQSTGSAAGVARVRQALYNTTSFISNIEHNYTTTAIFTQHWDG